MYAHLSSFFNRLQVDNTSYWSLFAVTMTAFIYVTVIVFGYAQ